MIKNLEDLIEKVKKKNRKKIVIAAAGGLDIIKVVELASEQSLAEFILIGDKKKIEEIARINDINIDCEIIHESKHELASEKAVQVIKDGAADVIMKGLLHTSTFLKAVLNKEKGLNLGKLVSQISVLDKECGEGLQLITDCAMSICPNLNEKKQIIENAIFLAQKIGYKKPRVALISALEVINPAIPDTIEAAVLSKMGNRGQIKHATIDGPFALDNAISQEAAENKGIKGEVAGKADILVVPNLQVGNVLTKSLTYYAHKDVASAVVGARAPIIMTSRTDSVRNKLLSIVLASYIA